MGLGLFGSNSSCACSRDSWKEVEPTPPNPNPRNYKVMEYREMDGFVIMRVKHPGCTNFEGEKVLVFKADSVFDVTKNNFLDPHFCKKSKLIARFVPTKKGYKMAVKLCEMLSK